MMLNRRNPNSKDQDWHILFTKLMIFCVTRIDHFYSIEQKNTSNNGSIQVNRVVAVVYIVISSEIVPRA